MIHPVYTVKLSMAGSTTQTIPRVLSTTGSAITETKVFNGPKDLFKDVDIEGCNELMGLWRRQGAGDMGQRTDSILEV